MSRVENELIAHCQETERGVRWLVAEVRRLQARLELAEEVIRQQRIAARPPAAPATPPPKALP